ncbi:LysE family transporter [Goodfellowiella coeruleoviolacea]|uniref:Arginine exporter protein ArgO n=1 Tax=Goodfellowiella coeruleoviolacea TaxID=334858 RepID=A0AAE3KKF5_9PSEU|nr:LysE family transporter [Goodfellowiella coeruleoviolacea]MCP2165368.1 Arginine exporter protein ArgO [Goodfellowiella coeruleoviolacea]
MTTALVAGLLAGYGIALPVGAVGAYLVALTARTSLRTGLCAALGVASADGCYALVAVAGGAALADWVAPVAVPLRWVSAAVLVGMAGWGAATAIGRYRRGETGASRAGTALSGARAYASLFGITLLNPATVGYFAALVVGGQHTVVDSAGDGVVFVCAATAASASWQVLLAGGGALLGAVLTGPKGRLATAVAASLLVTGLAVSLVIRV